MGDNPEVNYRNEILLTLCLATSVVVNVALVGICYKQSTSIEKLEYSLKAWELAAEEDLKSQSIPIPWKK